MEMSEEWVYCPKVILFFLQVLVQVSDRKWCEGGNRGWFRFRIFVFAFRLFVLWHSALAPRHRYREGQDVNGILQMTRETAEARKMKRGNTQRRKSETKGEKLVRVPSMVSILQTSEIL